MKSLEVRGIKVNKQGSVKPGRAKKLRSIELGLADLRGGL